MGNPEFPPNSNVSKSGSEGKVLKQVTSGEVRERKRSVRRQFQEAFVIGDMRTAVEYMLFDIALPSIREAIVDTLQNGVEKLFMGEGRRGAATPPQTGGRGYVNYTDFARGGGIMSGPQRAMSRANRARHNFNEYVLESRAEADEIIDNMYEVITQYGNVSVANLYELLGVATNHTDHKWGWTGLPGAGVRRVRNGWLLDLPNPHPID